MNPAPSGSITFTLEAHLTHWSLWPIDRLRLALGFAATVALSLSVHVVMLNDLGVPFPSDLPAGGWSRLPDRLLLVSGAFVLANLLQVRGREGPVHRWLLLFLMLGLINEAFLRGPFMDIIPSSAWTLWPFVDALPSWLVLAAVAACAVIAARWCRTIPLLATAALVTTLLVYGWLKPSLNAAYDPVHAWTAAREGQSLYAPPYDWHVQLPAYLTFAEPVAGAMLIAKVISGRLPAARWSAWVMLTVLLFALRGQFLTVFTYPSVSEARTVTAMLSFGQFSLESLALAGLAAATWLLSRHPTHEAKDYSEAPA